MDSPAARPAGPQGQGSRASSRPSSPVPQFPCEEAARGLVLVRHPPLRAAAALNLTVAEWCEMVFALPVPSGRRQLRTREGYVPLRWVPTRRVRCEIPVWAMWAVAVAAPRSAGARSPSVGGARGGFAAWLRAELCREPRLARPGGLRAAVLGEIFHVTDSLRLL